MGNICERETGLLQFCGDPAGERKGCGTDALNCQCVREQGCRPSTGQVQIVWDFIGGLRRGLDGQTIERQMEGRDGITVGRAYPAAGANYLPGSLGRSFSAAAPAARGGLRIQKNMIG